MSGDLYDPPHSSLPTYLVIRYLFLAAGKIRSRKQQCVLDTISAPEAESIFFKMKPERWSDPLDNKA